MPSKVTTVSLQPILIIAFFFVLVFSFSIRSALGEESYAHEGIIEPYEMVNVGTPVPGVVAAVDVQRSSSVTKGQPLVFLESTVERAIVERAKVLSEVDGDIQLQKERLSFAERMLKRIEELFQSEAISAEKYDQAATEVILGRARLQKAMENRELAQLDFNRAKAMLNRRTIKSPISGIVIERFIAPGEFVDDQPLLRVAQMHPLRVEVILPADMFKKIKPGMQADVVPETDADMHYASTVAIVDRAIDPASGTFGVRLELPNPDYSLPSGLKCSVRFVEVAQQAMMERRQREDDSRLAQLTGNAKSSLDTIVK